MYASSYSFVFQLTLCLTFCVDIFDYKKKNDLISYHLLSIMLIKQYGQVKMNTLPITQ